MYKNSFVIYNIYTSIKIPIGDGCIVCKHIVVNTYVVRRSFNRRQCST